MLKTWMPDCPMLDSRGIVNPEQRMRDYPHQLSGGMQQRAMIASTELQASPACCRRTHHCVDVTIRTNLKRVETPACRVRDGAHPLTHNIAIIGGLCDRLAVMFRGEIVEYGIPASLAIRSTRTPKHSFPASPTSIKRKAAQDHRMDWLQEA
jgi:ABC-type dipeptide/oligopeptide/nickel transport system ATPase component